MLTLVGNVAVHVAELVELELVELELVEPPVFPLVAAAPKTLVPG